MSKNVFYILPDIDSVMLFRGNPNNKFIGATKMVTDFFYKEGKKHICYSLTVTTKYIGYEDIPGLMYDLYSNFSKEANTYIMSDAKQSEYSKEVWKKWFNNPKKYKIKDIFVYNKETEKAISFEDIEDSWCRQDDCLKYRILVKF